MEYNFITNIESCYQEIPRLLYYSHIPTTIIVLFFGIFLLFKNKSNRLLSIILFSISLLFSIWTSLDLILWRTYSSITMMSLWSLFGLLYALIYLLSLYFVHVFVDQKDISIGKKYFLAFLLLPILIATPTRYNLSGFDIENCQPIENHYFYYYQYALGIFAIIWILHLIYSRYTESQTKNKKSVLFVGTGILLFLLTFSWSEIVGSFSENFEITQYGLFGAPIFIGFLVYSIVKFKTFKIKVLATEALVWALWIMIGAILFVAQTTATQIVTGITEIIAIVFGIMLIKTVRKEVAQREELQQLTQELATKNQKLQELDVQKSQFLSFASHDLKSPVNVIKQFASLIIDKTYSTPEKIMETAQKIKSNAERAVGLVDDFLDLRRLDDGKMEYSFEKKNLVALVHDITEDFKVLAKQQKNIDVVFTSTRNEIFSNLDTSRFGQVIQNLLSNSLKYTEAGSIMVSIKDEQSTALIEVKDTGIGMSAELIPTLFEQFHRAPGVAKKIQGTGLGLYISKQIVLGHGGEVWVSSDGAGKGSSFFVRVKKV